MFLGFVKPKTMPPKKKRRLSLKRTLSCLSDKKSDEPKRIRHKFRFYQFQRPRVCFYCRQQIWHLGSACTVCRYICHRKCELQTIRRMILPEKTPASGYHSTLDYKAIFSQNTMAFFRQKSCQSKGSKPKGDNRNNTLQTFKGRAVLLVLTVAMGFLLVWNITLSLFIIFDGGFSFMEREIRPMSCCLSLLKSEGDYYDEIEEKTRGDIYVRFDKVKTLDSKDYGIECQIALLREIERERENSSERQEVIKQCV
ncbi:hypothetical protein MAR_035660 [Mya arenaria]|uniref:Phorbol-ester/DAG-type domain-containing protein n=1 Tax=Mya arenaria TaxID=6604 RepID=A0ABY7ENR6_MYAAR|nr:hypothetical protein MAR_035660 [Mya arenaria]